MYNIQKANNFFFCKKNTSIYQFIGMHRQRGRGKVIKKFLITFVRIAYHWSGYNPFYVRNPFKNIPFWSKYYVAFIITLSKKKCKKK